jgi:hypothetical protein
MDATTARNFLIDQGTALMTQKNPDAFLMLLKQGKAPHPGQMTSILLALKTAYESTKGSSNLDRALVSALHLLAMESRDAYETGRLQGAQWPPLLAEDLSRLALAVQSVFSGTWLT